MTVNTRPNSSRHLRFSWLISATLALSLIVAAIPRAVQVYRQHAALKAFSDSSVFDIQSREIAPEWMIRMAGHVIDDPYDWFSEIVRIESYTDQFDDTHLKLLSGLSTFDELRLHQSTVTDAGMISLSGMRHLKRLEVSSLALTDIGLQCLSPLPSLEELEIGNSRISDEGLRHLVHFPQLRQLGLRSTPVTEAGLRSLSSLPNLQAVQLEDTPVFRDVCAALERGDSEWIDTSLSRTPTLALAIDGNEDTLLHLAVKQRTFHPVVVRTLLAAGMDLEAKSEYGPTVLERAATLRSVSRDDLESRLKFLLSCGAEYTMKVAIVRDDLDRVRTLMSSPDSLIDQRDFLELAIEYGRASIVAELIDSWKMDPDQSHFNGIPFVCRATENSDVLRELLERGANPNARMTPNFFSCFPSQEFVKDRTALHCAAVKGYTESAELLIERGATLDAQDCRGWTPLMEAVEHGQIAVLQLLVRHRSDPTVGRVDGETALTLAHRQAKRYPQFWKSLVEQLEAHHQPE